MMKNSKRQLPVIQTANALALAGWPKEELRRPENRPAILIPIDEGLRQGLLALCDKAHTWFTAGLQMSLTSQAIPAEALVFELSAKELQTLPESKCVSFLGDTLFMLAISRGDLIKLAEHAERFDANLGGLDINQAIADATISPAYVVRGA